MQELTEGVDDEGALGNTGPQDRYRRIPPLLVHLGIEDLDIDMVRTAVLHEPPRTEGDVGEGIRTPSVKKFPRGLGKEDLGERDHRLRLVRIDSPLELAAYGVDRRKLFTDVASRRLGGVAHGHAGRSSFAVGPRSGGE